MKDSSSAELKPECLLQSLDWTRDLDTAPLYAKGHAIACYDQLQLPAGGFADFGTLFGSFFEAYWIANTAVRTVIFFVDVEGPSTIQVYRSAGAVKQLVTEDDTGAGRTCCRLEVPLEDTATRIFLRIVAHDEEVRLFSAGIYADMNPSREVSFSLGFCCFNREPELWGNLDVLLRDTQSKSRIDKVYIVNQGSPFSQDFQDWLAEASVPVELIDQPNLGGTGGFTRTLIEARASSAATHHVLMDDDIRLDASNISRAAAFLAYCNERIALGGSMLDGELVGMNHETGAMLRKNRTLRLKHHGIDVTNPIEIDRLNTPQNSDYNGWWFSIVPMDAVRDLSLPPPLFIRWDDIFYGLNLGENGVEMISLPNVAVWHEPFYVAPDGWKYLYSERNAQIVSCFFPNKSKVYSVLELATSLLVKIAQYDYRDAALLIRAMEEFLAGPDRLLNTPQQELHQEFTQLAQEYNHERVDVEDVQELPFRKQVRFERYLRRWARHVSISATSLFCIAVVFALGAPRTPTYMHFFHENRVYRLSRRAYIVTNPQRRYHELRVPDKDRIRSLLGEATKLLWRYARSKREARQMWQDRTNALTSESLWNRRFEEDPIP